MAVPEHAVTAVAATATANAIRTSLIAIVPWVDYKSAFTSPGRPWPTSIGHGTAPAAQVAAPAAQIVPGLFQTDEYALEVTNGYLERIAPVAPRETRRRVEVRLARQQVLTRDNPLRLSAVLDESVLYRRFGDRGVMKSQIKKPLELSERDSVSLRILPLDGRHPIGTGAFVLFRFGDVHHVTHQDVVYIENLTGGRYVEEEEEVYRYQRSFDRLSELALDTAKSREMLTTARDRWN